jgi:hypothetical protein
MTNKNVPFWTTMKGRGSRIGLLRGCGRRCRPCIPVQPPVAVAVKPSFRSEIIIPATVAGLIVWGLSISGSPRGWTRCLTRRCATSRTSMRRCAAGCWGVIEVRLLAVVGGPTLDNADAAAFLAGFATMIEKVRRRRLNEGLIYGLVHWRRAVWRMSSVQSRDLHHAGRRHVIMQPLRPARPCRDRRWRSSPRDR